MHLASNESCHIKSSKQEEPGVNAIDKFMRLSKKDLMLMRRKYITSKQEERKKRKDIRNQSALSRQDLYKKFLKDRQNLYKKYLITARKLFKKYLNDAYTNIHENQ